MDSIEQIDGAVYEMKDVEIDGGVITPEWYESKKREYHKKGYVAVNELSKKFTSRPDDNRIEFLLLVIDKNKVFVPPEQDMSEFKQFEKSVEFKEKKEYESFMGM